MQTRHAADYANGLLADLGQDIRVDVCADHPAIAWRRSGLLETTQLMLPLPLASHADGALLALKALVPASDLPMSGALLMGERARLRRTVRDGRWCAGGYGQLINAYDGRIALNLVRDDDWDLIPAWLEDYVTDWDGIINSARDKPVDVLVERAAEIGLAVAKEELPPKPGTWFGIQKFDPGAIAHNPLVVDLSGLWAGPLASSLLQMAGARVIKVEGPHRPDGMRYGHEGFYALLNAGKDCAALDFRNTYDLSRLKHLIKSADIVIEASRPRALRQLGLIAEDFVSRKPGQIWARLTAYGRDNNRIGFGDDIGVSAGLSTIMESAHGDPCFVGDAIADPVNGIHLALLIQSSLTQGGGAVIDLNMKDCLRYAMGEIPDDPAAVSRAWNLIAKDDRAEYYPMRRPLGSVKPLGADNDILW